MASAHDLRRIGRIVAASLDARDPGADAGDLDVRLARLRATADARRRGGQRAPKGRGALLVAVAAVAAAASVTAVWMRQRTPLAFEVAGLRGRPGDWVAAPSAPVSLAFSDGSHALLHPAGRVRVVDVDARGARLLLERGAVELDVQHRDDTAWVVDAGPFEVRVVGTRFTASWDSDAEALTISMREGRVEVEASCDAPGRALEAGESATFACRAAEAAQPATDAAPAPASATAHASASTAAAAQPSAPRARPSWRDEFHRGAYAAAHRAVEARGLRAVADGADARELLELADLMRLVERPAAARETYLQLRARFPGTTAAAAAAFHLARLTAGAAPQEAERFLGVYLDEQPRGPFAGEALGRLLELQAARRAPAARETALRYLAERPHGAHAPLARSIAAP